MAGSAFRFRRVKAKPRAHPLVKLLISKMNEQGIGVMEMCREAGIARGTFTGWRKQNPKVDNLEACFNVVGYKMVVTPLEGDGKVLYDKAHPNSGEYVVTDRGGNEFTIVDLKKFCNAKGLSYSSMKGILAGAQHWHKNWTVRYGDEEKN